VPEKNRIPATRFGSTFIVGADRLAHRAFVLDRGGADEDQLILRAVCRWRYCPALRHGVQTDTEARILFAVRLVDRFSYNGSGEVAVSPENPNPPNPEEDQPRENREVEDFFHRLPADFRWPKPNDEAIAAAMEAIQRIAGGVAGAELAVGAGAEPGNPCSGCGGLLPTAARFCVWCGMPKQPATGDTGTPPQPHAGEQHHYHHHYHHFIPAHANPPAAALAGLETAAPQGRAPASPGASTGGRVEAAARQVAQDWAQACNIKHLDDLLELYAADATLIRSNVPPVRSLSAIREFLVALLEAGLGDVEMESLRVDVMGEIAMDVGRCKMLVPVAMGKRREERGKYLLVLVRQPAGTWKIIADCWAADLVVSAPLAPETAKIEPSVPARKPR